jgi:predicted O-methyltransferase YrrM
MLRWESDTHLIVDDADFAIDAELTPTDVGGGLHVRKTRWMIEQYATLARELDAPNVVELGIYEGGSTALLALLLRPRRLLAVDLTATRVAALDAFIAAHALGETVRPYFGVDQADRARLEAILAGEFGTEPLDLVVDDASHLLDETTASFNVLFPRLRPGGVFVFEDWSWQHFHDDALARALAADETAAKEMMRRLLSGDVAPPSQKPLSRLVLELVLTAAYADHIVAEIVNLRRGWLMVRRGADPLDPLDFDIGRCYGSLGRSLFAQNS